MCGLWHDLLFNPDRWRSPFCNELRSRIISEPAPVRFSQLPTPDLVTTGTKLENSIPNSSPFDFHKLRVHTFYNSLYTPPARSISTSWNVTVPPTFWRNLWAANGLPRAASTFYLILWKALPCAEYFAERSWCTPLSTCVFCKNDSSVSGPTHWFWSPTPCTHVRIGPPSVQRIIYHISNKTTGAFTYLREIDNIAREHTKRYQSATHSIKRSGEHANLSQPPAKKPHALSQPAPVIPSTRKRSSSQLSTPDNSKQKQK
jgi:hypothetical protein